MISKNMAMPKRLESVSEKQFIQILLERKDSLVKEINDTILDHIKPLLDSLELKIRESGLVKNLSNDYVITWSDLSITDGGDYLILTALLPNNLSDEESLMTYGYVGVQYKLLLKLNADILEVRDPKELRDRIDNIMLSTQQDSDLDTVASNEKVRTPVKSKMPEMSVTDLFTPGDKKANPNLRYLIEAIGFNSDSLNSEQMKQILIAQINQHTGKKLIH